MIFDVQWECARNESLESISNLLGRSDECLIQSQRNKWITLIFIIWNLLRWKWEASESQRPERENIDRFDDETSGMTSFFIFDFCDQHLSIYQGSSRSFLWQSTRRETHLMETFQKNPSNWSNQFVDFTVRTANHQRVESLFQPNYGRLKIIVLTNCHSERRKNTHRYRQEHVEHRHQHARVTMLTIGESLWVERREWTSLQCQYISDLDRRAVHKITHDLNHRRSETGVETNDRSDSSMYRRNVRRGTSKPIFFLRWTLAFRSFLFRFQFQSLIDHRSPRIVFIVVDTSIFGIDVFIW